MFLHVASGMPQDDPDLVDRSLGVPSETSSSPRQAAADATDTAQAAAGWQLQDGSDTAASSSDPMLAGAAANEAIPEQSGFGFLAEEVAHDPVYFVQHDSDGNPFNSLGWLVQDEYGRYHQWYGPGEGGQGNDASEPS